MKHKTLLTLFHLTLALGAAPFARAQTAFTYQGKLVDDCCPATGLYDLTFKVFDNAGSGSSGQQGSTVNKIAVPVTNGLFTLGLDFGGTPFNGSQRWLQMEARTNNPAAPFVTLLPRTELTPTPYSVYANKAGMVINGSITTNALATTTAPAANQILSYNGSSMQWIPTPSGTFSLPYSAALSSPGPLLSLNNSGTGPAATFLGGNVGIGTTSPAANLQVNTEEEGIRLRGSGSSFLSKAVMTFYSGQSIFPPSPSRRIGYVGDASADDNDVYLNADVGNVNLSTSAGIVLTAASSGSVGIGTTTPGGNLALAGNGLDGSTYQQFAIYADTVNGAYFDAPRDSRGNRLDYTFGWRGGDIAMKIDGPSGNVGIGTTSPKTTLHVNGDYYGRGHLYLHAFEGDGNSGTAYVQARDTSGSSSIDLQFRTQRNGQIVDALRVRSDGVTSVKVLEITGGSDLAEPFQMSEEKIAEGSVVVIDEENPGHLKQATSAYDTRVAGIVSGANGVKAGIALHQEGVLEGGQNVALTGRVYVKADASHGAIKPGDLLTTSDTPGHAMKVTDSTKAQGAILGKAMTALADGKGMVLVLVSLQ